MSAILTAQKVESFKGDRPCEYDQANILWNDRKNNISDSNF